MEQQRQEERLLTEERTNGQEEITTMREHLTDLHRQVKEKNTAITTLQLQITELEETLGTSEQEINTMRGQLTNLHEQLQEKDSTIKELTELQGMVSTTDEEEINSLTQQLTDLRVQLQGRDTTIQELTAEFQGTMDSNVEENKRVTELKSQLRANKQEIEEKDTAITTLQRQVTELKETLGTSEQEIKTTRGQLTDLHEQLQEKDRTIKELTELQGMVSTTDEEEINSLKEQLTDLRVQLQGRDTTIQELTAEFQGTMDANEQENKRVTELKSQLRANKQEMVRLEEQLGQFIQEHREQFQGKDATIQELIELQGTLDTNDEENEKHEEQFTEMHGQRKPSRQRDERVTELKSQLRSNEQEMIRLEELLEQFVQEHREELLEKDANLREHDKRSRMYQEQVSELQSQLETNEQEMTRMREHMNEFQEQEDQQLVTELQRQLREIQDKMTMMREELCQTQQRESELNKIIATYQSNNQCDWVIHRHEIELTNQELGRGAWGSVLRGTFHGCEVAVKQMHENIVSDYSRRLFEREVEIASRCRHPCLLQFIGATSDERPLLVTEIMECSLRVRLYNEGDLPLYAAEVSVISLDVARALNYLHQKPNPIIHRDISSGNVLLWRQGNQWRAKVSDYGTANLVRQSKRNEPGTAMYSAPECLIENPDQPISCKVDVYSFGVLLCEMNTGQQPDPQRRQTQIAEMTNRAFRSLVRRCTLREPGSRPNMESLIEEIG